MMTFEDKFSRWVLKFRWWIIVTASLFVLFASSGTQFLTFNNDTRIFFSEENPQLKALEALENVYTRSDSVLFALAPRGGNVFTRETLAALEWLTEAAWKMPHSSRVASITNFQHTKVEGDDLIVENLVENAMSLSDADLEQVKKIALSEPLLVNSLISPSGNVTGLNVTILMPGKSNEEVEEVAAFARKLAQEFLQRHAGIELYLTGGIMLDQSFGEVTQDDTVTLTPVMFLSLLIITGLALRSFSGTFATLIIIVISMLTAIGLAGWLRTELDTASALSPTIILTLAVADSIHILVTMFQHLHLGKSRNEAIAEALKINLQPIFLTSVTTAIGFLAMNFSDAPPFRTLGNIVATGVLAAFVYSVFLLPSLMAVFPVRVKPKSAKGKRGGFDYLADLVLKQRKPLFWSTFAVVLVLTAGILRIEFNDDWVKYFDETYDIRKATDFVQENLTGFDVIEYSLSSGEPGGINNPSYLAKVEEFSNWYHNQPNVVHVSSITETIKRLNKNMHGDSESYYRIPEQRDLVAQYLLLYEMSLPFGLDLNNIINVDRSATRMIVTLTDMNTKELRDMDEKARSWLKENAPQSMFTFGSGLSIIWAHLSERNINSMLSASLGALVLISMILILALRSFRLGLLSLIPNLSPAFMAFGVWGILVQQVGLSLSVVISMTLGIVVDDTVHFLSKYLRARRDYSMNPPDAIRYSFTTVGRALWITTLALVAGFLIFCFSGFKMNSEMGLMTAMTIAFALCLDFLFLPTLLMKVEKRE